MDIDPKWPEWVLRQDFACVFVRAPSPSAAIEWTRDPDEAATTDAAWGNESGRRNLPIRAEGELRAVPDDGGSSAKMNLFEVTPGRSASGVLAEVRPRLEY